MAVSKRGEIVGVDEGSVFTGPNPDGVFVGPVEGEDRAGVYDQEPDDDGIVLSVAPSTAPVAKPSKATEDTKAVVFTNTRYPEQKIAIVKEQDGIKVTTGRRIEFHSCKMSTTDPEVVKQIEALNRPYIYREPASYLSTPIDSDKFFRHPATGFRTLSKAAFEDWVNNSEWSAKPK